jgi:hypothetical protein
VWSCLLHLEQRQLRAPVHCSAYEHATWNGISGKATTVCTHSLTETCIFVAVLCLNLQRSQSYTLGDAKRSHARRARIRSKLSRSALGLIEEQLKLWHSAKRTCTTLRGCEWPRVREVARGTARDWYRWNRQCSHNRRNHCLIVQRQLQSSCGNVNSCQA